MYGDCLHAILTSYATYQSGYFGVLYIFTVYYLAGG